MGWAEMDKQKLCNEVSRLSPMWVKEYHNGEAGQTGRRMKPCASNNSPNVAAVSPATATTAAVVTKQAWPRPDELLLLIVLFMVMMKKSPEVTMKFSTTNKDLKHQRSLREEAKASGKEYGERLTITMVRLDG
jgi:hypothetical protein